MPLPFCTLTIQVPEGKSRGECPLPGPKARQGLTQGQAWEMGLTLLYGRLIHLFCSETLGNKEERPLLQTSQA